MTQCDKKNAGSTHSDSHTQRSPEPYADRRESDYLDAERHTCAGDEGVGALREACGAGVGVDGGEEHDDEQPKAAMSPWAARWMMVTADSIQVGNGTLSTLGTSSVRRHVVDSKDSGLRATAMRDRAQRGHTEGVLEILVVPTCFLGAGFLGYLLLMLWGVAGGLVAVGGCHLLAFIGANQALSASGEEVAWIHVASQWLFLGGFVALVWLAAAYPTQRPSFALVAIASAVGLVGPALAALSGPTPAMLDDTRELGPVLDLLPPVVAQVAPASLLLLPLLAVATFVVRTGALMLRIAMRCGGR